MPSSSKSVENGIDIIRIFDALNDLRNIEVAVDEAIKAGAHVQGTLCYTTSPIHTPENFVNLAKQLEKMGCPASVSRIWRASCRPKRPMTWYRPSKERSSCPSSCTPTRTTGLGPMTYLKAVEAGATTIDCAIACMSGGTSQPPTESMHYTLKQMGYESGLKEDVLKEINDFFRPVRGPRFGKRPFEPGGHGHRPRLARLIRCRAACSPT